MDQNEEPPAGTTPPLTPTGRFTIQPGTDRWVWSDGLFALHGIEPGAVVPTAALFLRHVHPDDRAKVTLVVGAGHVEPAGCEYRLVDLAGRDLIVTLAVDAQPDGTVVGLLVDVTTPRSRAVAEAVNAQLALALESRSVIDQAKGVVMSTCGVDGETAFTCLALISQHSNVRVRVLAEEIRSAAAAEGGLGGTLLAQIEGTVAVLASRNGARAARDAEPTHA